MIRTGTSSRSEDLTLAPTSGVALDRLAAGDRAVIQSVRDDDPELLRYLDQLGLRPGAEIRLVATQPLNELYILTVGSSAEELTIGAFVATQVFVRPTP